MIAHLLLLAALPVGAQSFDVAASTFWTIGYAIPDAYESTRFVLSASGFDAVGRAIAPCPWEPNPSAPLAAYARCRVDAAEAERLRGALRRLGPVYDIPLDRPAHDHPELYFKRDALAREAGVIAASTASIPAISGLLEAQNATLQKIIRLDELARRPVVEVAVVASTRDATLDDIQKAADAMKTGVSYRENPPEAHWTHHWARVPSAVCEQLPIVFVTRSAAGGPAGEKAVRAALRRLGEPFEEPGCRFEGALIAVTDLPSPRLMRGLADLDGLVSIRVSPRMRYREDLADDERFDALSGELVADAALLEKVPTVRAFVRGELERVRKTADGLRRYRGKRLIVVQVDRTADYSR